MVAMSKPEVMYSVVAQADMHGKIWLGMQVHTGASEHTFFLCYAAEDYRSIADGIYQGIIKAGTESRRAERGIIVAKEGALDGLPKPKGG